MSDNKNGNNSDNQGEAPSWLSCFPWFKNQGLKESKESDIDRSIWHNERNLLALVLGIVALLGYLKDKDFSNFDLVPLLEFKASEATAQSFSLLIRNSCDTIFTTVSVLFLIILFVVFIVFFVGSYLNHKAKKIEVSSTNDKLKQAYKNVEIANKRADAAEEEARQANDRADQAEARLKAYQSCKDDDCIQSKTVKFNLIGFEFTFGLHKSKKN